MTFRNRCKRAICCLSGLLWVSAFFGSAFATSKVGSGGDVVDRFLEDTKVALRITTERLLENLENSGLSVCNKVTRLNEGEKQFCNSTLQSLLSEYLKNFYRKPANEFKLSTDVLEVVLPDGTRRQVKARTVCGPAGPIELHYKSMERCNCST